MSRRSFVRLANLSYWQPIARFNSRAFPLLMESEAVLYGFDLTRFFTRTGIHPRVKPEDMPRSKTL
jgi:hypothetical protein